MPGNNIGPAYSPPGVVTVTTITYAYNGLGDRLQQSVGAQTTNYTLDINSPLTQVLTDGANTYLYGMERLAEDDSVAWEYFLPDALGSVRQVVDGQAGVVLANSYEPYGELLTSTGEQLSNYGFTGEWLDETGQIYLRTRYYEPTLGIFNSKDPLGGNREIPSTLNRFNYSLSNPLLYLDPTGECPRPTIWNSQAISIICVDLFISTPTILFGAGLGDDRGFELNSSPKASRGFVYIGIDNNGNIIGEPEVHINESETILRPFGPYEEFNNFEVSQNAVNGNISVEWDLWNGFSASIAHNVNSLQNNPHFEIRLSRAIAYSFAYGVDPINGKLELTRNINGLYDIVSLERDPYPSLEVYQYFQCLGANEIFTSFERHGPIFGTLYGLSPIAPRDTFVR